ncbi:MAG: efflux RND transporter periplasmic adaptor subunit [Candidatus Omnitrophica bacterium]|nr:efflux RND transporter periplasmic adaptor subunit [Candidatus Omnitrophota bacterium]
MRSNGWFTTHWRRLAVITAVLAVVALVAKGCLRGGAKDSKESFRKVTVTRQALRLTKTATGEVTPQNRVEVKPPIAGRIEEVLVREGDIAKQGQVLAWMSSTDRAALLDAARSQGPEALARWETAYKPAPLMAPLDGTVIVRAVEPGQTVTTSDPVVVIADRLIVKAQVDETDIGAIAVGQSAAINLDAFPQEQIPAHVDHVAYEAKTVNNVTIYGVDVLPGHVPPFMRSGMTATVTFVVAEKADTLVVPTEAVHQKNGETQVFVSARGRGRPQPQAVTTGLTDGKWMEITAGLQEGETILAPTLSTTQRASRRGGRNPFSPFSGRRGGGGGR